MNEWVLLVGVAVGTLVLTIGVNTFLKRIRGTKTDKA